VNVKPLEAAMWIRLLSAVVFLLHLTGALAAPLPVPRTEKKEEGVAAKGRTVILGTWGWKIEGNQIGAAPTADFHWERESDTEGLLIPQKGAGWAILAGRPFGKVGLGELRKATYSSDKLSSASLRPGTVLSLRTQDGRFARVKVVGYRRLHDTSFPEATLLGPGWIRFAQARRDVKEYHLEVDWALFKAE
jgi:hypothetical protein